MKILVVGSGGREHSLCWTLAASPLCEKLFCAPGNAGIAQEAECVPIAVDDIPALVDFAKRENIELVVVGPEAPLVAGLVDRLDEAGIRAFGPTAAAAALEGSKGFTKDLCAKYGIPTADYQRFTEATAAKTFVRERSLPIVIKADGLAAGKGVVIATSLEEADRAIEGALEEQAFGEAGAELVIEDFMEGEEVSFFALVDGTSAVPLASAQDYKRVFDDDQGPNTGGMGAYSPAPLMTDELAARVMAEIIEPTVAAMEAEGRPFKGVLYAGLMITPEGAPKLVEYNVRFGDPECQVLLMRLMSDLVTALVATCDGVLGSFDLRWYPEAALCIVMATEGYPGSYAKGSVIGGLEAAESDADVTVFHAGTKQGADGACLANGGRVLGVTALGESIGAARERAYAAVDRIDWPEGFCRRDIGARAVE